MARHELVVNGERVTLEADGAMPLLWALRDLMGLTGTKYGCGVGLCGSCTILEGDSAIRSCQTSLADAKNRSFTTIEGLSPDGSDPVQQAWLEADVAQCGYCQPGMILELKSLIRKGTPLTDARIDDALSDHVCRCGSYPRIRKAVGLLAREGRS